MARSRSLPAEYQLGRPSALVEDELAALVRTCDLADVGVADTDVEDIREWLGASSTSPDKDGWVVTGPAGRILAWAYIEAWSRERSENANVYIHPDAPASELVAALTDLLVRRAAARAAEEGRPDKELAFYLTPSDVDLASELAERGCTPQKTLAQMRRTLDGTEGRVPVPAGVTLRSGVDPSDDNALRAFHDVVTKAFAGAFTTPYDDWRSHVSGAPTTAFDEWLTAESDGRLVAVMQAVDMSGESMGWVRNLAVLPAYQGRGIARAMLDTAFAASYRKGRKLAGLGVNVANTSAYKLYESVGMTVTFEVRCWPLVVPAATVGISDDGMEEV